MGYGKIDGRRRRWAGLGAIGLLATPALSADGDAVIRQLAAQDAALTTVGERLSTAARELCPQRGWAPGVVVQTITQYGVDYRIAARAVLGLADRPTITFVVPGGAADRAGAVAGDRLTAIDSRALATIDSRAAPRMADTEQALAALQEGLRDGVAVLTVLRDGASRTIRIAATPACDVRFEVRAGNDADASATRDRVQVSSDLIDPARADQDLAPLVAHELAHVVLGHEQALEGRRGGVLPGFGRNGAALRASELAADRLSVYLLARAGYRPADAVAYWTAYAKRRDLGILSDRTHPKWEIRIAAIRAEAARVEAGGRNMAPPADIFTAVR